MENPLLARSTAYHEAGHIVVAALLGRRISRHGIHVDCVDLGVAFFDGRHCVPHSDMAGPKVDTIVAIRAGFIAQRRFWKDAPLNCAEGDQRSIDALLATKDSDDPADLASVEHQAKLTQQAEELVTKRWDAIGKIAEELASVPCADRNYEEPNTGWSGSDKEKKLDGHRIQEILKEFQIPIEIWDPRPFALKVVAD